MEAITARALDGRIAATGYGGPVSQNFDDDLEARFGLMPDFVGRLRDISLLYDRDHEGEYFQLYRRAFGKGFFFEVIERCKGDHGYGAVNAISRSAAQRRLSKPVGMPRE